MTAAEATSTAVTTVLGEINLARTWNRVQAVIENPGADRTLTVLLIGCAALALALLILSALLLVTPSKRRVIKVRRYHQAPPVTRATAAADAAASSEEKPYAGQSAVRAHRAPLTGAASAAVAVGLLVAAVVAGYVGTSLDAYCARTCHAGQPSVEEARGVDHSSCRSCHEDRLVLAAVSNSIARVRMAVNQTLGISADVSGTVVASTTCMTCHSDVEDSTVVGSSGVAMSHKEVIDAAIPCVQCHSSVGHDRISLSATMSDCVVCHDSVVASSDCDVCHTQDPVAAMFVAEAESGKIVGTGDIPYPAVRAAKRDCGICHDLAKECDGCHGIRMPHSEEFIAGAHARGAAFEGKLTCWDCHDPVECGDCHASFNPLDGQSSHAGDWKTEHKASSWDAGCVCHDASTRKYPICYRCHTRDRELRPIRP